MTVEMYEQRMHRIASLILSLKHRLKGSSLGKLENEGLFACLMIAVR